MDEGSLAEDFDRHRDRLRAIAYRMLGSIDEADDAVQEAWLRLQRSSAEDIDNLAAWLTTVVTRICLNVLRSRRTHAEEPLEAHVPDLIIDRPDAVQPEHEALLADAVGTALMTVIQTLPPAERVAFVLHDSFAVSFDEIATIVDRSLAAARQLASRGRRKVHDARTTPDPDRDRQRAVVDASSAPRGRVTSTAWSPSSTPTWCCGATPAGPPRRGSPGEPRPSPAAPSCSPAPGPPCARRWSTAPPASWWTSPVGWSR